MRINVIVMKNESNNTQSTTNPTLGTQSIGIGSQQISYLFPRLAYAYQRPPRRAVPSSRAHSYHHTVLLPSTRRRALDAKFGGRRRQPLPPACAVSHCHGAQEEPVARRFALDAVDAGSVAGLVELGSKFGCAEVFDAGAMAALFAFAVDDTAVKFGGSPVRDIVLCIEIDINHDNDG
jgi:hypothetical protein